MREIKFRAMHKKEWIYVTLKSLSECVGISEYAVADTPEDLFYTAKHKTQYTGLKDKNGKEIYEGDILKWTYSDGEYFEAEIVWKDFTEEVGGEYSQRHVGFILKWIGEQGSEQMQYTDFPLPDLKIEVIGNIYENPEEVRQ